MLLVWPGFQLLRFSGEVWFSCFLWAVQNCRERVAGKNECTFQVETKTGWSSEVERKSEVTKLAVIDFARLTKPCKSRNKSADIERKTFLHSKMKQREGYEP